MPLVKIDACRQRSEQEITAIIDAVYEAQRLAFKLPEDDKQIRYAEHAPHCFPVPPGKTDNYMMIDFSIFPGRSLDAKRRLYAELAERLGRLGIQASDLVIVLHEPSLDNWGVRGKPASEVELGFELKV